MRINLGMMGYIEIRETRIIVLQILQENLVDLAGRNTNPPRALLPRLLQNGT